MTMTTLALPVKAECPKAMRVGPCGGTYLDGACEIDRDHLCVFLDPARAERSSRDEQALIPVATTSEFEASSRLRRRLDGGAFAVVAEVNGADSADVTEFVAASRLVAEVADVVSITDHSGANVHMGNVAAAAHLQLAGIDAMPTFGCRDRNRLALQGDLLGVASLGVRNVLVVTGNHVRVGDSPEARAVFDLDSPRLLTVADRLRRKGEFDNGRRLDVAPDLYLGSVAHPFAPPVDDRPRQLIRKVRAGADFVITQHIFDLPTWRRFLAGVNAQRDGVRPFHLLGGVAIMPSEPVARQINAGLRGFTIPDDVLGRLRQAKDPQDEGIEIAAETVRELVDSEGVSGCLLAPVTGRQNALTASVEQQQLIAEVRRRAGIPATATAVIS